MTQTHSTTLAFDVVPYPSTVRAERRSEVRELRAEYRAHRGGTEDAGPANVLAAELIATRIRDLTISLHLVDVECVTETPIKRDALGKVIQRNRRTYSEPWRCRMSYGSIADYRENGHRVTIVRKARRRSKQNSGTVKGGEGGTISVESIGVNIDRWLADNAEKARLENASLFGLYSAAKREARLDCDTSYDASDVNARCAIAAADSVLWEGTAEVLRKVPDVAVDALRSYLDLPTVGRTCKGIRKGQHRTVKAPRNWLAGPTYVVD